MKDLLRTITESRANYRASFVVDAACPIALAWFGLREAGGRVTPLVSLCAGVVAFSFVEYAIHRWLFHRAGSVMGALHKAHHDAPQGHSALPCVTSAVVGVTCWIGLAPLTGTACASFFLSGLLGGYAYYSLLHHLEHSVRINALPFRWLQTRWAQHSVHHRLVDTNFGVTTSFWDHVFATHYQSRKR
jgi:sterol desaturase/sphingolipid hydroxylase (fatty acid hydroxylase superfamily)